MSEKISLDSSGLKVILRFGNWRFEYCGHDHFPNVRVYETDGMIGISTVAL